MSVSETRPSKPIVFCPSVYRPFQRLLKGLVKEFFTTYLNHFIVNKMRMSHIYQPVMLMKLLESGGEC
jgi:hypothetical protein